MWLQPEPAQPPRRIGLSLIGISVMGDDGVVTKEHVARLEAEADNMVGVLKGIVEVLEGLKVRGRERALGLAVAALDPVPHVAKGRPWRWREHRKGVGANGIQRSC